MITEKARVVDIRPSGELTLEVQRKNACGSCELQGACGIGAIGRLLGMQKPQLRLPGHPSVKTGDIVTIGIAETALVQTSLAIYLLPLLALLLTAVVGDSFFGLSEWSNVLLSLGIAAFVWYQAATHTTPIQVELLSSEVEQQ